MTRTPTPARVPSRRRAVPHRALPPAFCAALLVFSLGRPAPAAADPAAQAKGVWLRDDGNARVRVAPCGPSLCATNLWIGDTSGGEAVGDLLVMRVAARDADTLGGTAYDPKRKMTFSMEMTVAPTRLVTRGCVLGDLLCRSVSWRRVE
ncbi:DUF2147 domain-containing protein [Ancylobacter lacus]|uniref:DUF2147 domain-containing protein n=1 Tax=Ancylobacter lacus TaxID=2579970 RepID=UPI001BCE128A|nr:DUF2147 domain-containing protein [Ancylobacter lacus]MBS7539501.1 DUF2147 domain-containing protein [Ancylobacter lacus]